MHGLHPLSTHSQFVEDDMLIGVPSTREASTYKEILNDLYLSSGTSVNNGKCQIFFFNMPPSIQRHISHILGFMRTNLLSKYLGIPLINNSL